MVHLLVCICKWQKTQRGLAFKKREFNVGHAEESRVGQDLDLG